MTREELLKTFEGRLSQEEFWRLSVWTSQYEYKLFFFKRRFFVEAHAAHWTIWHRKYFGEFINVYH